MRLIDKLKKKLKRLQWWKEHGNKVVLWLMVPCALVHLFLTPFFPLAGIVALSTYLIVGVTGGFEVLWAEENLPRRIEDLKGHIDALQGVKQETLVEVLEELAVAEAKQPQTEYGKREKVLEKRELTERTRLIKRALEEQNLTNDDEFSL